MSADRAMVTRAENWSHARKNTVKLKLWRMATYCKGSAYKMPCQHLAIMTMMMTRTVIRASVCVCAER